MVADRHKVAPGDDMNAKKHAVKKRTAVKTNGRKRAVFAICSVCHASVLVVLEGWVVYDHWLPDHSKCSGSGIEPYDGPPSDYCAACGAFRPIRQTDGRIAFHRVGRNRCDGSGKAPGHGRSTAYMKGTGVSVVVQGGSPGLGKRR